MKHRPQAWDYLLSTLAPDFALLQEATPPPALCAGSSVLFRPVDCGTAQYKWGNAIYSKNHHIDEVKIDTRHVGCLLSAEAELSPSTRICFISMYGLLERTPDNQNFRLVNAGTHRMLSDLAFLLMGKTAHKHRNFVLCGDMNQDRRMDDPVHGFVKPGQRTTNLFFERVEDFQLVDGLRVRFPQGIQTFRTPSGRSKMPWQLDYMFTSRSIWDRNLALEVIDNESIRLISDHNPIIGTFAIG